MNTEDKIKKLFQSSIYEDRLLACSLLGENYNVRKFMRDWEMEIYGFRKEKDNRPIIPLPSINMEFVYYKYTPRTFIGMDYDHITLCFTNYNKKEKVIEHEYK